MLEFISNKFQPVIIYIQQNFALKRVQWTQFTIKFSFKNFFVKFIQPSFLNFHTNYNQYLTKNIILIKRLIIFSYQNKILHWTKFNEPSLQLKSLWKAFFLKFVQPDSQKLSSKLQFSFNEKYYFIKKINKFYLNNQANYTLNWVHWTDTEREKKRTILKKHQVKNSPYERLNYPKNSNNRRMWRTPQTIFDIPSLALTRQREGQ